MEVVMNCKWMLAIPVLLYLFPTVVIGGGNSTLCTDIDHNGYFSGDLCIEVFDDASSGQNQTSSPVARFLVKVSGVIVDSYVYFNSSSSCITCDCTSQSMTSCHCPQIYAESNLRNLSANEIDPQGCPGSSCAFSDYENIRGFGQKHIKAFQIDSAYNSTLLLILSTDGDLMWSGQPSCDYNQPAVAQVSTTTMITTTNSQVSTTTMITTTNSQVSTTTMITTTNSAKKRDLITNLVVGVSVGLILIISWLR